MTWRAATAGLLVAALGGVLAGCGGGGSGGATTNDPFAYESTRPVDARVVHGGVLYTTDGCASCHSVDGSTDKGPTFRNLAAHRTDAQLLRGITHHVALNPPSAALQRLRHDAADARALADFIESITSG